MTATTGRDRGGLNRGAWVFNDINSPVISQVLETTTGRSLTPLRQPIRSSADADARGKGKGAPDPDM